MTTSGSLRTRVMGLMENEGPQSVNDLCVKLGISYGSSRSVLVKMLQAGKLERIGKGIYRKIDDEREYSKK